MEEFYGSYKNVLDAKGRINMPARFREAVKKNGDEEPVFIMTKGTDKNVAIIPIREWRRINRDVMKKLENERQRRMMVREINTDASYQKVDKQGRINIPTKLIEYAELSDEVILVGTGKRIEVWNPENLNQFRVEAKFMSDRLSDILEY